MKYPSEITVKGYNYQIEFVDSNWEVLKCRSKGNVLGAVEDDVIRVSLDNQKIGVFDTFIHEVLHAVINRNPALQAIFGDNEEVVVNTLGTEFALLLVENGIVDLDNLTVPDEDDTNG